jgi:predicted tellurium resistance membrane protein TerC
MYKKIKKILPLDGAKLATLFGLLTTICTALAVFDIDTLDFENPKTYIKLAVVILPAIGGYMSTLTKPKKQQNEEQN